MQNLLLGLLLSAFGLLSPWPLVRAAPTDSTFLLYNLNITSDLVAYHRFTQYPPLPLSTSVHFLTCIKMRRTHCTSILATYRPTRTRRTSLQRPCPHTCSSCSSRLVGQRTKSGYYSGIMYGSPHLFLTSTWQLIQRMCVGRSWMFIV